MELLSVEGRNEKEVKESLGRDVEKESIYDRGEEVRSRMEQLAEEKLEGTFQKMMKKLERIERRKRLMQSFKTEVEDAEGSIDLKNKGTLSPLKGKNKKKTLIKPKIRIR